ncbi:CGNR zinc finger domain-containing protein [Streptomyces albidoflavus]
MAAPSPLSDPSAPSASSGTPDDWSTRHSVRAVAERTVALVNALASEHPDPVAVAGLLLRHGERDPLTLTEADVAEMRSAALRVREVLAAPDTNTAAHALNLLLASGTGPLRLTSHAGTAPWHPHLDRDDDAAWGEWLLASSCMALAVLLWDRQLPPGAVCTSASCQDVFLTQGSGPTRRYCSRRCATRERVAAHRKARA